MRYLKIVNALLFLFFCHVCVSAEVLPAALDGYCSKEHQYVLQNESIALPSREKNPQIKWSELNEEALADAFIKNTVSTKLGLVCSSLISLSIEDIRLGFRNKPKKPFDFYLDQEWAGFFEKYPTTNGIIKVSQPGYSKDRLYSVIYIVSQCAPLCGYAELQQYQNVNGKWVLSKSIIVAKS